MLYGGLMTQRDEGHDFRDSKNKAEEYERKLLKQKKKRDREQADRLIEKWDTNWKYDAFENNRSTWSNEDDEDATLLYNILREHRSKFD